ncbi:MAG: hypothetical protein KDB03_01435 [Planctomycetales bacterium]|nr:hypothetical protein [Planctomycetales bacterium]
MQLSPSVLSNLQDLISNPQFPLVHQVFPDSQIQLDLLSALARVRSKEARTWYQDLKHRLDQLSLFTQMSRCPVVAVAGLLNAGKSSLIASYLSPHNRSRVLRGVHNQAGTHRFVLWLPKIWSEEPELVGTLIGFLGDLFEHPPEILSEDPQQAMLQYNGQIIPSAVMGKPDLTDLASPGETAISLERAMQIPLIAYDPGLDALKLGLVDCPDIQTGFLGSRAELASGEGVQELPLPDTRRELLQRIGRLCSAFVVVSKLSSLHDESLLRILTSLRDAMPGVPRILAVNRVKLRYSHATVHAESRPLIDRYGIRSVFVAYDYRSSLAAARLPAVPDGMQMVDSEPLPIFVQATPETIESASKGSVEPGGESSYLFHLGKQLDVGTLAVESSRSLNMQLQGSVQQAIRCLQQHKIEVDAQTQAAWQAATNAAYDFMAERDATGKSIGLRLQTSPTVIAQMTDSLQRTAPMWMKFSLGIDRTARQLQQAVANSAGRFKILQSASVSVTQFVNRFRRGEGARVLTAHSLAEGIRKHDWEDAFAAISSVQLLVGCEAAIKRFAAEDKTQLNSEELDAWSREVWHGMSLKDKLWKGTRPLAVMLAPLLAAVLVPIDGGGTAVLVFASTKELLAAAGIAAVVTPLATGGEALGIVQRETPWRQLSNLFAVCCDCLGLPRPGITQLPAPQDIQPHRLLLPSSLPVEKHPQNPTVEIWEWNPAILRKLEDYLQQLR